MLLQLLTWEVLFAIASASTALALPMIIGRYKEGRRRRLRSLEAGSEKRARPEVPPPPEVKRVVHILGLDSHGKLRGVYKDERIHTAVFGYPGTGKTTLMLFMICQHIRRDEGFMVLDPHGDLAKKVLSHIPPDKWHKVVYIDPLTAFDKFKSVVQLNFIEYRTGLDKGLVARTIMDALAKYYGKFWGPRLDMIMLNSLYLLLEGKDRPRFSEIYDVLSNEAFREELLGRCRDDRVRTFWEGEFKKMPKDASSAVMTKIYRIVQEKIIVPMFDCEVSSIDFRKAMDEGLFVIVNLEEGRITSDLANFLGSLILAKVYLAGMSREDIPEDEREPFYVYVDEAYRFTTSSTKDILQSLRKYKVYMTLAAQYLGQYREDIRDSIPSLCDILICFSVGKDTAKHLEEFYQPVLDYRQIMDLPRYYFAASAIIGGRREAQVFKVVDYGKGKVNIEEVVKASLSRFGRPVDVEEYLTKGEAIDEIAYTPVQPAEHLILRILWEAHHEKKGVGANRDQVLVDAIMDTLKTEDNLEETEITRALHLLIRKGYIGERDQTVRWEGRKILARPNFVTTPVNCMECGLLTQYPFWVKCEGGVRRPLCQMCAERALKKGELTADRIEGLTPKDIGEEYHRSRSFKWYFIRPSAINEFFLPSPAGPRGGGTMHTELIKVGCRDLYDEKYFMKYDLGEEAPKRRRVGRETVYVTKRLPDVLAYPLYKVDGKTHPRRYDMSRIIAVEAETNPLKHQKHTVANFKKCKAMGLPVRFVVPGDIIVGIKTAKLLRKAGANIVEDIKSEYKAGNAEVVCVDPETEMRFTIRPEHLQMSSEELEALTQRLKMKREGKTILTLKPPEPTSRVDVKMLAEKFRDWSLTIEEEGGTRYLYAERDNVKLNLGPATPPVEEYVRQLQKPKEEKPATTKREAVEKPPAEQEKPQEKMEAATKQPEREKAEPQQKPSELLTKPSCKPQKGEVVNKEREEKILAYKDWPLFVERRKGKLYLYARKYDKSTKKRRVKYLGLYDEEAKEIIKRLRLRVREPRSG